MVSSSMVWRPAFATLVLFSLAAHTLAQTIKVMPFGASIISRCWRANLQQKLRDNGVTNFDFVGSLSGSCAGAAVDQDHEGHAGWQATDYAKYGNLTGWLNQNPPDVVIMLVGTNDVLANKATKDVIAAYDVLVGQMRTKNPKVQIVFSNLLPLDPARFSAGAVSGIKSLNAAIAAYVPSKSTPQSTLYAVDNYSGFDAVKDTTDGEHPNDSGNEKIANQFLWVTKTAIHAATAGSTVGSKVKQSSLDNDFTIAIQDFVKQGAGR